jgi:hypothetical protein
MMIDSKFDLKNVKRGVIEKGGKGEEERKREERVQKSNENEGRSFKSHLTKRKEKKII